MTEKALDSLEKTHLSVVVFGTIVGIVGVIHGGAALLQGARLVDATVVTAFPKDWPNPTYYELAKGGPVFTVFRGMPFLVQGLAACLISIGLIAYSLRFLRPDSTPYLFIAFNVGVFLFGAGIGTPISIGLPVVVFWLFAKRMARKKQRSARQLRLLSISVYFWLGVHALSWVLFFPVFIIMSTQMPIPKPLFDLSFMLMPISVLAAMISALIFDTTRQTPSHLNET